MPQGKFYSKNLKKWVDKETERKIDYDQYDDEACALLISYWRWYPDKFVDLCEAETPDYSQEIIQRINLRAFCRYQQVFITGSRGTTKTHEALKGRLVMGVLWPGITMQYFGPNLKQTAAICSKTFQALQKNYPILCSFWDVIADSEERFVLKTTHGCGGIYICKDKAVFDKEKAANEINKTLCKNYYLYSREWPYKNVKPRIIAEEYMVDESGYELKDYKIFTFGGKARALLIAADRTNPHEETHFDFYDMEFNHLPFTNGHPCADHPAGKPDSLDEMRRMAEHIAAAGNLPQARIDFYDVNGTVYFGEITFFHWSGFEPFVPDEWDKRFGEWLRLPEKYPANGSGNCRSREKSE